MKFIYQPEGAQAQEWPFQPGKLLSPESEAIEKVTGLYLPAWQEAVAEGSQRAMRAFLWVMLKRQQSTLKFDQLQVAADEMEVVYETEDAERVMTALEADRAKRPLNEDETAAYEVYGALYEELAGKPWKSAQPADDEDETDGDEGSDEGEGPKAE